MFVERRRRERISLQRSDTDIALLKELSVHTMSISTNMSLLSEQRLQVADCEHKKAAFADGLVSGFVFSISPFRNRSLRSH